MIFSNPAARSFALAASICLAAALPTQARAQDGYMFKAPVATMSFRIGVGGPSASGDLFDFFTDELTLERGDFRGIALAADLALRTTSQLDLVLGIAYDGSS